MKKIIVSLLFVLSFCLTALMLACSSDDPLKSSITVNDMTEQLQNTQRGDLLEFPDNQFAFVKMVQGDDKDVILLRHIKSPSSRVPVYILAEQVIAIHRIGDSDRCEVLERLAESIYY